MNKNKMLGQLVTILTIIFAMVVIYNLQWLRNQGLTYEIFFISLMLPILANTIVEVVRLSLVR